MGRTSVGQVSNIMRFAQLVSANASIRASILVQAPITNYKFVSLQQILSIVPRYRLLFGNFS